jgi:hypothetical protein
LNSKANMNAMLAKTRVAVFGSFMGGYHVLRELLLGPLARRVIVVGLTSVHPRECPPVEIAA